MLDVGGPKSNGWCPKKRGVWTQTSGEKATWGGGRDGRDELQARARHGCRQHPELEEAGTVLPRPGTMARPHLHLRHLRNWRESISVTLSRPVCDGLVQEPQEIIQKGSDVRGL